MPKRIEQLYMEDLKAAFYHYLDAELTPKNAKMRYALWLIFWNKLKKHCSVVETL